MAPSSISPTPTDEEQKLPFKQFDVLDNTIKSSLIGGVIGLTVAAIRNAFDKKPAAIMTTLTRHGHTIPQMGCSLGTWAFVRGIVANIREKDDWIASASGCGAAGAIVAMPTGKLGRVVGNGLFAAFVGGVFTFTGGRIGGFKQWNEQEEFERKERMRAGRRKPIEETIAEIGEGRGIKPPGYEERRRQRLKEKYGIIVDPVRADVD